MKSHQHNGGGTQNQNNTLGDRSCVRQSKLFRMYESGNNVKDILGTSHLAWKTDQKEGAYRGHDVFDHNASGHVHGKSTSYRDSSPSKAEAAALLKAQMLHDEVSRVDRNRTLRYEQENIMSLAKKSQQSPQKSALKKAIRDSEPDSSYNDRRRHIPDYNEDDDAELSYLRERLRRLDAEDDRATRSMTPPEAHAYMKHVSKADLDYLSSGKHIGNHHADEERRKAPRHSPDRQQAGYREYTYPNLYDDRDEDKKYDSPRARGRTVPASEDSAMRHPVSTGMEAMWEETQLLERQLFLKAQIESLQRLSDARPVQGIVSPAPFAVSNDEPLPTGRAAELRRLKENRLAAMMQEQGIRVLCAQTAKEKKMIEASRSTRPW